MEIYERDHRASSTTKFERFRATMYTDSSFFGADSEMPFDVVEMEELGFDPSKPTTAHPGSEDKVKMLAARYAVGLPLWHDNDCNDHAAANDDPARVEELLSSVSEPSASDWDDEESKKRNRRQA